jgi:hypothetical protein
MALNLFAAAAEIKKDSLVEFRAGRMNLDPNTKVVRADKRKGLVQLKQEDGLIHFVWKDRSTNQIETDLMIFQDEAVFRKVDESKARVYVLEFKSGNKKLFFWIQEPSDEKDEKNCADINKFINNPPQPGTEAGGLDDKGLGNLDQNQLLQFLASAQGGNGNLSGLRELLQRGVGQAGGQPARRPAAQPTATTPSRPATTTASRATTASTTTPTTGTSGASGTALAPLSSATSNALKNIVANFAKDKVEPTLMDVVNVEEILKSGLLENEEIVKKLVEFLPEGHVNAENLKDNLNSSQFKEAVRNFNQALRSGELSTIVQSFGLDASNIGPNSTIEDFLLAVQKSAKK